MINNIKRIYIFATEIEWFFEFLNGRKCLKMMTKTALTANGRCLTKYIYYTMAKINLRQYGITGVKEVVYNPSYDELYREETKKGLRGFEKGTLTEMESVTKKTDSPREITLQRLVSIQSTANT